MLLIVYCVGVAPISSSGLMAMPSAAGGVVMPTTGTVPLMQPTQGGGVAMAQATPPGPGYVTQQQYYQVQQGSGHAPQQTYSARPLELRADIPYLHPQVLITITDKLLISANIRTMDNMLATVSIME